MCCACGSAGAICEYLLAASRPFSRDAGMARLALEDRLEDPCALELHGISLISRRGRDDEFDRIEDLRFIVVGIGLRHTFHALEIGEHAGRNRDGCSADWAAPAAAQVHLQGNLARQA
jgi:hypothetical protein